jgi:hypothetical protein
MRGKSRHIAHPVAERRHADLAHADPVVEIRAEPPFLDHGEQIAVTR